MGSLNEIAVQNRNQIGNTLISGFSEGIRNNRECIGNTILAYRPVRNFATEFKDASAPLVSRPCIGLAPGAKGSPDLRPSGVAPVFLPYITLLVIVSAERVWIPFL